MENGSFCRLVGWVSGAPKRSFIAVSIVCSILSAVGFSASGGRELLGEASQIVPESIRVGPNGKRFVAVVVDPQTKKRRVTVNCKRLPESYDLVAKKTPVFSQDGKRIAFVASRDAKCFVVVDGKAGRGYATSSDLWPIADLIFSPTGRYLAYKAIRDGKSYLVINGEEFGPYDNAVSTSGEKIPGIGDFRFTDKEDYFSYRAKSDGGMVACRGWIRDGKISLTTSKKYKTIGAGSPVWLRGKAADAGQLFAFIARENGKDFIALLPKPKKDTAKPKMYDSIRRGSLICAANRTYGFVASNGKKWMAVVGDKEWKPCDEIGELMASPSGRRWACGARIDEKIVMFVDGQAGPAYTGIRHPGTVFGAGSDSVIYAAIKNGRSLVTVDGKEGDSYGEVDGGSLIFGGPMAYAAGDGKKHFVILNGWKGPSYRRVSNFRFGPLGRRFAYHAQDDTKTYVVIDGKTMGPYLSIAPDSPIFSPDGRTAAWAVMGEDGSWRVHVDGNVGPALDSIVSGLTFAPDSSGPGYVARILSEGKYSFALVSHAGVGRKYSSIWMGDGGRLFVGSDGRAECFVKQGPLVYKVTDPVGGPKLFLSDIKYARATAGGKDRPAYNRTIKGGQLVVGGVGHDKGIGAPAPCDIAYNIDAIEKRLKWTGALRFTAAVGLDDRSGDKGTAVFSVYADDKKLASSPLLRRGAKHQFDTALPPKCRTVRLVTSDAGDGNEGDWCDWGNAAIETGAPKKPLWSAERIEFTAQQAWLKGQGLLRLGGAVSGWDAKARVRWDFVSPADGTYELFISYGCPKEDAGSEFAVDIAGKSLRGKVQGAGAPDKFGKFSAGKVALKKGEVYNVIVRLTKLVKSAMRLGGLELVREKN